MRGGGGRRGGLEAFGGGGRRGDGGFFFVKCLVYGIFLLSLQLLRDRLILVNLVVNILNTCFYEEDCFFCYGRYAAVCGVREGLVADI